MLREDSLLWREFLINEMQLNKQGLSTNNEQRDLCNIVLT